MIIKAIIVAAGKGRRLGRGIPKAFIDLEGRPILYWSILPFDRLSKIAGIVIVSPPGKVDECKEGLIKRYKIKKVISIVEGGKERQDSVWRGMCEIGGECDLVIIHDGARPFLSEELLDISISKAAEFGASIVAVRAKDSVKYVDEKGMVEKNIPRERVWLAQTPQVFQYDLLYKAHLKAKEESYLGSDEASLVERMGVDVKVVEGSYSNIKITTNGDLEMAKYLINKFQITNNKSQID